jgi:hypothetical protein
MKALRVYRPNGREYFAREGETIPVGWYRDGQPPVLLAEPATVIREVIPGNPYDQWAEDRVILVLRTASEAQELADSASAKARLAAEADRLTSILRGAGVDSAKIFVSWGRLTFLGQPGADEARVRAAIPGLLREQARIARERQVARRKARLAKAYSGMPDIRAMAAAEFARCGWVREQVGTWLGSVDPRPCRDGEWSTYTTRHISGDYSHSDGDGGWVSVSNPSGDRTVEETVSAHPRYLAAVRAARRAYRQGRDPLASIRSSMGDILAEQAHREASDAWLASESRIAILRADGLRWPEVTAVLAGADESRLRDIADARKNWRRKNPVKMARNGRHQDAIALVRRAQDAHAKAESIRSRRERERARAARMPAPAFVYDPTPAPAPVPVPRINNPWGALDALAL